MSWPCYTFSREEAPPNFAETPDNSVSQTCAELRNLLSRETDSDGETLENQTKD